MDSKLTFCEECRKDVACLVESASLTGTLKGSEYTYLGKKTVCVDCGAEVYISETEDENLKALYDAYRQKNGIISLEKILGIPSKYNIGKRPLSLLLGWGEMTLTRYCEGDMPTKQYADILQKIDEDPSYYLSVLEENKGNLKSQTAYEKSKRATLVILGGQKTDASKVDEVIGYLLFQCEDITPLSLQKALYYSQGFYFAFMGSFLFSEDCEAWVHGPVYRDIYNRYSTYRFDPIEKNDVFDVTVLTDSEKAIIDSVTKNFCCYSGRVLERFTHAETPWLHTRGNLATDENSSCIIHKEAIGDYFSSVKRKYNMLTPNDIENYSQVMFEHVN